MYEEADWVVRWALIWGFRHQAMAWRPHSGALSVSPQGPGPGWNPVVPPQNNVTLRPIFAELRIGTEVREMKSAKEPDTEELLELAATGDRSARLQLLVRHRGRLRQMVALRIDRRMAARLDPSDVVQEALVPVRCS